MYYLLRKDCYIRDLTKFGYIKSSGLFNDIVFDESGNLFLSALTRIPKDLDELSLEISKKFIDVSAEEIKNDVKAFFDMLVDDGYVVKGETYESALLNNKGFDYSEIKQITIDEDLSPKNVRANTDSQEFLDAYFKNNPYICNFQIELTSKCNERCIHCYIPHEFKDSIISDELYYSVLQQLKSMKTLGVTLSGGEPMAHPKFCDFLRTAKEYDFYVHVLSNLTLLTDEIVAVMKEGNTCAIQVSLYSMIPEHHDYITAVKGSFIKTRDAILKLISNNIPVQINCPVMKANKNDVADVLRWGHEHKIRVNVDYSIMAQYNHNTTNLANRLTPEECKDVIRSIINYDENYRTSVESINIECLNDYASNMDEPFCGVGLNTACMICNGDVYPCPGWQGFTLGNLNIDTLENIWKNSKQINFLRNLKKRDMEKCLKCESRMFCSPCLARFANESKTGNPLEVATHFCDVAEVNKEVVLDYLKNKSNE